MNILIAIPAYKCATQIKRLLVELDGEIKRNPQVTKVIIIENNGNDDTLSACCETVKSLSNNHIFEVYQNSLNYGLGGTHKVAIKKCVEGAFTHLLILHGDHQASPSDIKNLIEASIKNGGITTLGSRFGALENLQGYSRIRTLGNVALNLCYSLLTGKKITDLGSGLNLFHRVCFADNSYLKYNNGFIFNMDLLLHLVRKNVPFIYQNIFWSTTDQVSNAKAISVGSLTLMQLLYWRIGIVKPDETIRDFESKLIL